MKSSTVALSFVFSVSRLIVGTASAEIRCPKAASGEACSSQDSQNIIADVREG